MIRECEFYLGIEASKNIHQFSSWCGVYVRYGRCQVYVSLNFLGGVSWGLDHKLLEVAEIYGLKFSPHPGICAGKIYIELQTTSAV